MTDLDFKASEINMRQSMWHSSQCIPVKYPSAGFKVGGSGAYILKTKLQTKVASKPKVELPDYAIGLDHQTACVPQIKPHKKPKTKWKDEPKDQHETKLIKKNKDVEQTD